MKIISYILFGLFGVMLAYIFVIPFFVGFFNGIMSYFKNKNTFVIHKIDTIK